MHFWKGKGEIQKLMYHREIMLCDSEAKAFGTHLRGPVMDVFREQALGTQFGEGLNGGCVEFTSLYCRSAQDIAAQRKMSMATIFGDVKMAFASLCRALVMPMPET